MSPSHKRLRRAPKAAEDALTEEGISADIDGSDIKVDTTDGGDKTAAYDEAEELLLDAGATVAREKVDNGTAIAGQYSSGDNIDLAVTDTNGITVNYLVTPSPSRTVLPADGARP